MNADQMEAVRELIAFARAHAEDVYGDSDEYPENADSFKSILAAADTAESYMND